MGAWGPGVFENDTALEWLEQLRETGKPHLIQALETARESPDAYVNADSASTCLAAAALIALARGHRCDGMPDGVDITALIRSEEIEGLARLAIVGVTRVLHSSELSDLWRESAEWSAWKASVEQLTGLLKEDRKRSTSKRARANQGDLTTKYSEGDVLAITLAPNVYAITAIVFISETKEGVTGIAVYGTTADRQFPPEEFFQRPLGVTYAAHLTTWALGGGVERIGNYSGFVRDRELCRYSEPGDNYYVCDRKLVPQSEAEKELIPSMTLSLGLDALKFDLKVVCGLNRDPIDRDIAELQNGSTKLKRYWAARRLAVVGIIAAPAVPALCNSLSDDGKNVRRMSAIALERIGDSSDGVINALKCAMEDPDPEARAAIIHALQLLQHRTAARRSL